MQMGFIKLQEKSDHPVKLINLDMVEKIIHSGSNVYVTFQSQQVMTLTGEEAKTLVNAMEFFMHPKVNSR